MGVPLFLETPNMWKIPLPPKSPQIRGVDSYFPELPKFHMKPKSDGFQVWNLLFLLVPFSGEPC